MCSAVVCGFPGSPGVVCGAVCGGLWWSAVVCGFQAYPIKNCSCRWSSVAGCANQSTALLLRSEQKLRIEALTVVCIVIKLLLSCEMKSMMVGVRSDLMCGVYITSE